MYVVEFAYEIVIVDTVDEFLIVWFAFLDPVSHVSNRCGCLLLAYISCISYIEEMNCL